MTDQDRMCLLNERLREMERRTVPQWQAPILEVARRAVEAEIRELGRRMARWSPLPYAASA